MFYRLGPEIVLCSPWRSYLAGPRQRVLVIRAWGVFPPGHATTRLCLDLLREAVAARPGARLLDLGCGSGVLTLAAAAWGVPLAVGVDVSWRAARLSRANAAKAGRLQVVQVVRGSTECLRGPFAVILANLPPPVQLEKAVETTRLAAPGGLLILSGFRDTQEEELTACYEAQGWSLKRRLSRDEWALELPPEKSFTWVAWLMERQEDSP